MRFAITVKWRFVAVMSVAVFSACAINPEVQLEELLDREDEVALPVTFFPQTDFQCGPAALAGILDETGVKVEPDEIAEMVYLPARQGSLQAELLATTRRLGRIAYEPPPRLENLLSLVAAGKPVLLLQNLGVPSVPIWHYSVLVGFKAQSNVLLLNDGKHRSKEVPAGKFLRTWQWADQWAMIAIQPGEIPTPVEREGYFLALSEFAQTNPPNTVRIAWRAASRRWPDDGQPYLALGNLDYGAGDLVGAAQHFRTGLKKSSNNVALTNNFAHVLGELGCAHAGASLLEPLFSGLSADSPWRTIVADTLEALRLQTGPDAQVCAQWSL